MKKFDLDNLPNLKIRVKNSAESERAQLAFFALGYEWFSSMHHADKTSVRVDHSWRWLFIDVGDINSTWIAELPLVQCAEITLEQLEALAAEKQGLNSFETMVFQEVPTSGKVAIEAMEKAIGSEDDASWGEFEPGELQRAEMEAQARYDAARQFMANFPNGSAPLLGGYVDKALKIAAGLKD